nr:hypothetical protein [Elizabethkingia sp. ASV34]
MTVAIPKLLKHSNQQVANPMSGTPHQMRRRPSVSYTHLTLPTTVALCR